MIARLVNIAIGYMSMYIGGGGYGTADSELITLRYQCA